MSNPKAFYNYVNSKTKTTIIVGDLINDTDSTVASDDKEKADALNIFSHQFLLKRIYKIYQLLKIDLRTFLVQ